MAGASIIDGKAAAARVRADVAARGAERVAQGRPVISRIFDQNRF